jgi:hypothetical protein
VLKRWESPKGLRRGMLSRSVAALVVFAALAHAQTSRGTVTGTVLDVSGAVIARAHVTLTGEQTGVRLQTESNQDGVYRFDAVDPGVYDLGIAHPGFKAYFASKLGVEANRVTTIDPKLEVGDAGTRVEVNAESSELLTKDSPLRGGNFDSREARDLPLVALNPLSLARTLPGATEASGSTIWGGGYNQGGSASEATNANGGGFSINGQRPRGNNYLLDGTENNESFLSGEEQVFTIADAIEEVSVQTGDFGVEFGRAGGGVFNVITKSGTNGLHGTLLWRYQSEVFDSVRNTDRLNGIPKSVFSNNIYGFTAGGPVRKDKTFFFVAFQENAYHSTANYGLQVPTAGAVTQLEALFPGNQNLALYLNALGNLRGTGLPYFIPLGADPVTHVDRGQVQFATASYTLPAFDDSPQWFGRIDHYSSTKHRFSIRYLYDSRQTVPESVSFPGFVQQDSFSHQNVLFSDTYTIGSTYTNEFRSSYERPDVNLGTLWPGSSPLAQTLPQITITNVSAPGVASANGQFHHGNNYLFQEAQTKLVGRHAFRYGVEFLRELITQQKAANDLGSISFMDGGGYSAFANFLDDYSGPSAKISRTFGAPVFYPNQLHQTYFFQDNWKVTPSLALTMGLRYENFGQFANTLPYPAFSGFDPSQFLVRHTVKTDNKDFGPAFGLAWTPAWQSNLLGRWLGGGKTVWRGGYQISYDSLPTQLIALGPAVSDPNAITTSSQAPSTGRGTPGWLEQIPTVAGAPSTMDSLQPLDGNLLNPYTERWSFGFQRELSKVAFLDVSYVGSESHRLTTREDWNPRLPVGTARLYSNYGPVIVKTSDGNSSYNALQAQLEHRFAQGFQLSAAYTWSKMIDSTSDGVGAVNIQDPSNGNLTSVPVMYGGMKIDRAVSDFDRPQRVSIAYLWVIPGPRRGWEKYTFGGWQLGGITIFQSGTPFSVANGFDRANFGDNEDRADIGNPNAPLNTRAVLFSGCGTGYQNPDTLTCVSRNDVHWVEGKGFPNGSTVGRNTLRTGGTNNFDVNLTKLIPLSETRRLELRWEALNAFNHPQYVNVPAHSVVSSLPGYFLNRDYTDSGIRSMWAQVKLVF